MAKKQTKNKQTTFYLKNKAKACDYTLHSSAFPKDMMLLFSC